MGATSGRGNVFLPEHLSSQEELDGKTPQGKTRQKTNNHLKKYTQQT